MYKDDVDPRESLETIRTTLQRVRRHFFHSSGPVYKVWGLVWLIAFGMTGLVETGRVEGVSTGPWIGLLWFVVTGIAGLFTFMYYKRQPVETAFGLRFGLAWPAAFTLMGFTVGSLAAAGLSLHGIEFGVIAIYTVAVIYLITGAILIDNLQIAVGIWLGVANIVSLQLGLTSYSFAMGVLGGGGLIVAGFIEDRMHTSGDVNR